MPWAKATPITRPRTRSARRMSIEITTIPSSSSASSGEAPRTLPRPGPRSEGPGEAQDDDQGPEDHAARRQFTALLGDAVVFAFGDPGFGMHLARG